MSFPSALADGELNYAELFKSRAKPIFYPLLSALDSRIQVKGCYDKVNKLFTLILQVQAK